MPEQKNLPLVFGIGTLFVIILGAFAVQVMRTGPRAGEVVVTNFATSTGSGVLATSSMPIPKKKTLPPEPVFVLPSGAVAIDGYAYLASSTVYFRSLTGKTPLAIPNSDVSSFKRLADFVTYPGSSVVNDCGAAPIYTYYGDNRQVYFYQVWRAPKFRSSTIEVIIGAEMKDFTVTGIQTSSDGTHVFTVGYEKTATSTCKLFLSRTP